MSDINALALQSVQILAPFLPYLIKGGIEAGKAAAGKLGELAAEKGWAQAKELWDKLSDHEKVKDAAKTAAKLPDDADAQAALRLQIKLVLAENAKLASALEELLAQPPAQNIVKADNGAVAIGGNASNNMIITGDRNKVER